MAAEPRGKSCKQPSEARLALKLPANLSASSTNTRSPAPANHWISAPSSTPSRSTAGGSTRRCERLPPPFRARSDRRWRRGRTRHSSLECRPAGMIALDVSGDFRTPVSRVRFWPMPLNAIVSVPEAAIDEDDHAVARQHDIRLTGQVLSVEAEPKPGRVQRAPHGHFDASVLASDRRHVATACLRVESPVGHHRSVVGNGRTLPDR